MGEEVVLLVDGIISPWEVSQCRICHEEEIDTSERLEAPCACNGTVKFAHRKCIQRWCDEKGNTTCEICLQTFEPGYTAPLKRIQSDDVTVTIRRSLEVPRQEEELNNPGLMAIVASEGGIRETDYSECSSAAERSASCYRSLALTFTVLLLVRHLLSTHTNGTNDYTFTIIVLFVVRASGIFIPLYIMVRTIGAIQNSINQLDHESDDDEDDDDTSLQDEEDDEQRLHHMIQIQA